MNLESVIRQWPRILKEIGAEGNIGTLGIALQGCAPMDVSGETVTFGFEKQLWRKRVEQPGVRDMLEGSLSRAFGKTVRVQFKFGVKPNHPRKPLGDDPVVETAVRELGFEVAGVEPLGGE